MTDQTPLPFTPTTKPRTWRVSMADGSSRTITASTCRTDCGCLLFAEASGLVVAMAAGEWRAVELEAGQ